jgi:glycine cleavage system H protein
MEYPDDLYYSKEHTWVRLAGGRAVIGITDHAQKELGEIVFVDFPEEGVQIEKAEVFGTLESSKTVAELYAPVSGEVVSANRDLEEEPTLLNDDPYGNGWLITMEIDDPDEVEGLLNSVEYENYLEKKEPKKEAKKETKG